MQRARWTLDSTDHLSPAALNDDELDRLVEVIVEQFGSTLDRAQFADLALTMIEHPMRGAARSELARLGDLRLDP
jgi:hypothetical protein